MATGDILSVAAIANGGFADITIEGLGTGGTYDLGLGAGNNPATGSPKVVFTVVSQGYTGDVLGTRTRAIYGTVRSRKPWSVSGDELTAQESASGGNVTVRVALSESIYDSDNNSGGTGGNSGVAPTVTIAAGFYTQGGTPNNAVSNLTVTNNSTLAYPRVIGNWSRAVNYEKVGSTIRLGVAVFHGHAQSGQQVAAVKFIAADASGNSQTVLKTASEIDETYGHPVDGDGEKVLVIEHVADITLSSFTPSTANQGDVGTFNFIAYPFIGNGASVLDTAGTTSGSTAGTGTAAAPSPYYGPLSFVCDPNGTYCQSFAVVDAANGNDGTGAVGVGTLDTGSPPASYATIGAAYTAVRSYNNSNYSRNNCGGSTIYLRDNAGGVNNFAWMGTTVTASTRPQCVWILTRYPGHSRDNVVIATQSGNRAAGELVKVVGVKITAESGSGIFDLNTATSYYVIDQCEIDSATANRPLVYRIGVWSMTRCLVKNLRAGWTNYGGVNSSCMLCRGCTVDPASTFVGPNNSLTILGNLKTNTTLWLLGGAFSAASGQPRKNNVIAYNRITASNTSGPIIIGGGDGNNNHGSAYAQNVLENCNDASPALQIAADNTDTIYNNVLIFHNVVVGQRCSMCYNEYGARPYDRLNWFVKNNIADDYNIKGDTFAGSSATATRSYSGGVVTVTVTQTGHQYQNGDLVYIRSATPSAYLTTGAVVSAATTNTFQYTFAAGSDPGAITALVVSPHPARIGNFPVVYGVNHSGNVWAETTGIGAAGAFMQSFTGLKCLPAATTGEPPTSSTNPSTYLKFVDRKSFDGSTSGSGNGDYHLQSDSPAVALARDWILPYGLDGVVRTANGAVGAYEYSSGGGGGGGNWQLYFDGFARRARGRIV